MPLKRKALEQARMKAGYSQEKLAEKLDTTYNTVNNWINARTTPYPEFVGKLCRLFDMEPDKLLRITEEPDEIRNAQQVITVPMIQNFIATSPTRQFWQIVHTDDQTPTQMTTAIQAAIKELHMMTGDNITRRDALCELASIPYIVMGTHQTLKSSHYEEMLKFCTAALEGCWELMRGWDLTGRQHAFECCNTYVPLLDSIARNSSEFRVRALSLATRYALLQTRLGWTCATPVEAVSYAQHAVSLSNETGNVLLQISACTKLTWTYLRNKNYVMGWNAMQEGEYIIKSHERQKKGPALPSGIIGNFNSSYALAQVHNGVDPDTTLGLALDSKPLRECTAFVEFTEVDQYYEAGKIYCIKGDPVRAMNQLGKLISTETLKPLPRISLSNGMRLHTINHLTSALLQLPDKDMGKIIDTWTTAMEGAQKRHNDVMYNEAMANYAIMQSLWSGERAIRKLLPLTSHW